MENRLAGGLHGMPVVGVAVTVAVRVTVGEAVAVAVAVGDAASVGDGDGVAVAIGVRVADGAGEPGNVGVMVAVLTTVGVGVAVEGVDFGSGLSFGSGCLEPAEPVAAPGLSVPCVWLLKTPSASTDQTSLPFTVSQTRSPAVESVHA